MTKKILITCLFLLLIHWLLIKSFGDIAMASHQQQRNAVKVQQYLYEEHDAGAAIVGTSLSAVICMDSMPSSVRNISFEGGTVEEGLQLIAARKHKPSVVFVESNYLTKKPSSSLISDNTVQPLMTVRRHLPFMQEQYQPICFLTGFLSSMKEQSSPHSDNEVPVSASVLQSRINLKLSSYPSYDEEGETQRLHTIRKQLDALKAEGCRVVLFEMPVNSQIRTCDYVLRERNALLRQLPADKYEYMPCDTSSYATKDGIHLSRSEAARYTSFFKSHCAM